MNPKIKTREDQKRYSLYHLNTFLGIIEKYKKELIKAEYGSIAWEEAEKKIKEFARHLQNVFE